MAIIKNKDHRTLTKRTADSTLQDKPNIPEREVGHFNSKLDSGISVDVELQLGVDIKDEQIMKDFISKFEKARLAKSE